MKNRKKLFTMAATVFVISGGLLALNAVMVPSVVNQTVVAQKASLQQNISTVSSVSSTVPVMKIEATAPVSTVESYLEQTITDEEIQLINNYFDENKKETTELSRELTEEESNRLLKLGDQYVYDGLRPTSPLPLEPGPYDFYLDMDKDIFFYPKRPMTDQELLQHIDWYYRINYVLSKRVDPEQQEITDIKESEAVKFAAASVKKIFDVDVSKLEVSASLHTLYSEQQKTWSILFQPYKADTLRANGQAYLTYIVILDSTTGTVIDTTVTDLSYKRTPISSSASLKISKDASWVVAARQIVTKKLGETRAIKSAKYVKNPVNDKRGMVNILITLEDGSTYDAELRYPEKTLRCLLYNPAPSITP
ncbi:hypothetical protein [Paenibacillus sp. Cedars]|uniref:hypothetical protein n=1 Tax=Paenibacillus sp. Cedars TaxID=1980674 RepID=UPI001163903B|nr:hypothetical protein [Paenibacillus sp. Cedars]AWP26264.1 hypothetical protein B9D94_06430 [Paenibacillus sp. Cedars]